MRDQRPAIMQEPERIQLSLRARRIAFAAFIVGFSLYFLRFTVDGLNSWFSNDDLMNMHYYWVRSWPAVLWANVNFTSDFYRPMGGLFCKALYSLWGFQPGAYRIAALIIVALNVVLLYLIVRNLVDSVEAGAIAVLLTGLNASFVSIYYDTGMIYDVLAFFFYYSALYWYLRIRRSGKLPGVRQGAFVLILLVAGLNSKEIAVSLPVAFLVYELLWHPPGDIGHGGFLRSLWRWSIGPGRMALLGGVVVAAYVAGKYLGRDSLFKLDAYRPEPSAALFAGNYAFYLNALFLDTLKLSPAATMGVLAALPVLGCLLVRRHLAFAGIMASVSFLPLAFIPPRGGFALYVPSLYWSMWIAGVLVAGREWLVRVVVDDFVRRKREWPGRRLRRGLELASRGIFWLGLVYAVVPVNDTAFGHVLPIIDVPQNRNLGHAGQLRACLPQVPKGSRILLLDDPYGEEPHIPFFLIREIYDDPTLSVDRSRNLRLHGVVPDPDNYDLTITYSGERCQVVGQSSNKRE
jgi:hypothetical protein